MYLILLAIGAFVAIVGAALIRYGVPLDEYGNSPLLVSGMVALVGGLIVIALSLAVRSLGRIAERLDIQPLPLPPIADIGHAAPPPRPTIVPPAIKPEPVPEVAAPEPRVEPRIEPSAAPPPAAPAAVRDPAAPAPPKSSLFGGLFGGKKPLDAAAPGDPSRVDLAPTSVPSASPPPAGNGTALPKAAPASGAAVYKSGVIDGMAYTLYVDGSIEAELPQGTIRFASVEALQTYLTSRSA
jgi:hypothetical protein